VIRAPADFADLLSAKGRAVLAGRSPSLAGPLADPKCRFVAPIGLIDRRKAAALRDLLDRKLRPYLSPMSQPIPPETIWEMTANYAEWLPKTMRVNTAYLERRQGRAWQAANAMGLVAMLRSPAMKELASALAGRPLRPRWGIQVLCYQPGDYFGPHNDHHPEEPAARKGYIDIHVSLPTPAVASQWLVYAERGHFTRMADVARLGTVSAYRLPFWHYTTPLQAKPGREAAARRWVLLATFLFQDDGAAASRTARA
jgi:hypothetical protein